jgi:hypothetical protein
MQNTKRMLGAGVALSAALALLIITPVSARGADEESGHGHGKAQQHGGTVVMTEDHHFELVFDGNMVKVYGYDGDQNPISLQGVSGSATLRTRRGDGGNQVELEYHSGDEGDYLEAHIEGLSDGKAGKAKIAFELSGLSSGDTTTFIAKYSPPEDEEEGHGHHDH